MKTPPKCATNASGDVVELIQCVIQNVAAKEYRGAFEAYDIAKVQHEDVHKVISEGSIDS